MANVLINGNTPSNKIEVSNSGAKYYGDLAKKYRDEAEQFSIQANKCADIATQKSIEVEERGESLLSDIVNTQELAISTIASKKEEALEDIEEATNDSKDAILLQQELSIENVVAIKNDLIQELSSETSNNIDIMSQKEIELSEDMAKKQEQLIVGIHAAKDSVINNIGIAEIEALNNVSNSTTTAKDWANKIGESVDGIEYSAKHYAQIAEEAARVSGAAIVIKDWSE